jgi:D-arginine dehydrogenase
MTGVTIEADVAVIGAGIGGVSVAHELTADATVVLLEQEDRAAYHTTGRSAAMYLESYGPPAVRALTSASRPAYEQVGGLLSPRAMLWIARPGQRDRLTALHAENPSLVPVDEAGARELCPVLRPGHVAAALLEPGAMEIDVLGLHQHYLGGARRRGLRVLLNAPVTAGHRDHDRWVLDTGAGVVRTRIVVNAAGAWADRLAATLGAKPLGLTPLRRTIAIALARGIDPGWPLVGDAVETFYCRPESGGLLISPADETPSEPVDAVADELDVARALERVNAAITVRLRSVATTWAGLRTFAPDRVPVAGWDSTQPGLFWLAGQGGYGIQLAPALAELGAALIRGEQPPAGLLAHGVDPAALAPARFG